MLVDVAVDLPVCVCLDDSVEEVVIPDLAVKPLFVVGVLVADQRSRRQSCALFQGQYSGSPHATTADFTGPFGSFGRDGSSQIGMLRSETQELNDRFREFLAVGVLAS